MSLDALAQLPTTRTVRDLLSRLLSRDVAVWVGDPYAGDDAATTYAVYVDDRLRARVVVVADLEFSALAGAAIGLVPPVLAHSAIGRGKVPATLAENLDEVLNVCAAGLNGPDRPHLRLYSVHHVGEQAPTDVLAFAAVPGRRLDLGVHLPTYGDGRLSFVGLD